MLKMLGVVANCLGLLKNVRPGLSSGHKILNYLGSGLWALGTKYEVQKRYTNYRFTPEAFFFLPPYRSHFVSRNQALGKLYATKSSNYT